MCQLINHGIVCQRSVNLRDHGSGELGAAAQHAKFVALARGGLVEEHVLSAGAGEVSLRGDGAAEEVVIWWRGTCLFKADVVGLSLARHQRGQSEQPAR
jgi:hypothetical protein